MSSYNKQGAPVEVCPPPQTAYPPPGIRAAYPALPPSSVPPPGYPVNGATPYAQQVPLKTKQRGEGFWKGCVAAMCCCFLFEACCE